MGMYRWLSKKLKNICYLDLEFYEKKNILNLFSFILFYFIIYNIFYFLLL